MRTITLFTDCDSSSWPLSRASSTIEKNLGDQEPSVYKRNLVHPVDSLSSARSRSAMEGNPGASSVILSPKMNYPSGNDPQTCNQTESPKSKSNSEGMKTNITIIVCFVVGVYGVITNKTDSLGIFFGWVGKSKNIFLYLKFQVYIYLEIIKS